MNEIVYHGFTADELSIQYNPALTVPDLPNYQKWAGEQSARVCTEMPCVRDIAYGEADIQKLDIFAPRDAANAPVLIDIHGGGWTAGSKNSRAFVAEAVVSKGVVWVPIDYGLAPAFDMTAIVDHVREAIAWIHGNIADHGGDPDRLYVSGNSAGGHLTGTCLMTGWQAGYGIPADTVKGACAMSGVFDLEALVQSAEGPNNALKMDMTTARQFSPQLHIPPTSPPLIVGYGAPELPEFIRQSKDFAAAWEGAGHKVSLVEAPEAHHFAMSREFANPDSKLHQAIMSMMGV